MILDRPPGQEHERVRERRGVDEALERNEQDECGSRGCRGEREDPGPRRTAIDPREQEDEEERHDDEEISLLDALREHRRERRDDEHEPERDRERRREQSL